MEEEGVRANFFSRLTFVVVGLLGIFALIGEADNPGSARPSNDEFDLWQELLSENVEMVLKGGLFLAAAFVSGAVVQRAWMANFAFKIGSLEIPPLAEASKQTAQNVEKQAELLERVRDAVELLDRRVSSVVEYQDMSRQRVEDAVKKLNEVIAAVDEMQGESR